MSHMEEHWLMRNMAEGGMQFFIPEEFRNLLIPGKVISI